MATPGTKWICEKSVIVDTLKKNKGRVTQSARDLSVAFETLKKRIDADSELSELLIALRNDFENTILDMAENVIGKAMQNQAIDPNNALKSAFFTLNSKGKTRGWTNTIADIQMNISPVDIENKNMEIEALKEKLKQYEGQIDSDRNVQDKPETES